MYFTCFKHTAISPRVQGKIHQKINGTNKRCSALIYRKDDAQRYCYTQGFENARIISRNRRANEQENYLYEYYDPDPGRLFTGTCGHPHISSHNPASHCVPHTTPCYGHSARCNPNRNCAATHCNTRHRVYRNACHRAHYREYIHIPAAGYRQLQSVCRRTGASR